MLEALAIEAGLAPTEAGYLPFTEDYPDQETMARGYMAAAPFVRAARAAGEAAVREALTEALGPLETPRWPLPTRGRGPLPDRDRLGLHRGDRI